ncbi:Ldh family oxidoreductase [Solwaraspora sp. WMMD1047]|uniref:Ldh family oxidoreductase n=1 Tax=Solwaraspora sp. WMMD1047 TaxID=3016102 RepID=UPI0024166589|nr:Ldh family oxidoreductase [Solwaraspora sp. WMMD1047]MDG4832992.1 Ldh family oxidoreductase [Solwaraspora sp. WMMD1047]
MTRPGGFVVARVPAGPLVEYLAACYRAVGVADRPARRVARVQVDTDRRGILSHGSRLAGRYLTKLADGRLNPRPRIRTVFRGGVCRRLDADGALGPWAADVAVRHAAAIARRMGAGVVAVSGCGHIGAAGSSAISGAAADMLTLVIGQTGAASVAPDGSVSPVLGNTPVAVAVPRGGHPPIVADLACGAMSWGAVSEHRTAGRPLPGDVAYDDAGLPTRDAGRAAVLRPFGGAKGSALAVIAEILAGTFTGSAALPSGERRGLLTVAIHPRGLGVAVGQVEHLAAAVRDAVPVAGIAGARLPGDRGWEAAAVADRDGIGLDAAHLRCLTDAGRRYGVDPTTLTDHLITVHAAGS